MFFLLCFFVLVLFLFLLGGLLYLVNILVNSNVLDTKVYTAEIIGRLYGDKISGPRVRLLLGQFLPPAICDAIRDAPTSAINLLQNDQENPEIIWNDETRTHVSSFITNACNH